MDELKGFREQVCRLGKILKQNSSIAFPAHLQHEWKQLDDLLVHASVCSELHLCNYRNCYKGKLLYRHILFICEKNVCKFCDKPNCLRVTVRFPHRFEPKNTDTCQLCDNMLHLLRFHAGTCSQSNCIVPRCRENKEKKLKKEQWLRRIEEQLKKFPRGLELERATDVAALQFSLMLRPKKEEEKEEKKSQVVKRPLSLFVV